MPTPNEVPLTPELERSLCLHAALQVHSAALESLLTLFEMLFRAADATFDGRTVREWFRERQQAAEDEALLAMEKIDPGLAARFQRDLGRDLPPL
jgi:hypothetical protein